MHHLWKYFDDIHGSSCVWTYHRATCIFGYICHVAYDFWLNLGNRRYLSEDVAEWQYYYRNFWREWKINYMTDLIMRIKTTNESVVHSSFWTFKSSLMLDNFNYKLKFKLKKLIHLRTFTLYDFANLNQVLHSWKFGNAAIFLVRYLLSANCWGCV